MSSNELIKNLDKVINYIEEHIEEKLTLDKISSKCYFSKFYLSRVFKSTLNISMMEYVRKRKLARSVHDLLHTEAKISDIADKYNFSHTAAYIRAFKNTYGISPKRVLKEKIPVKVFEKLDINKFKSLRDNMFVIEPTIVLKTGFNIVGVKHKIYFDDNVKNHSAASAAMNFIINYRDKIKKALHPNIYIGYCEFPKDADNYKYYIPSFYINNTKKIPEGMVKLSISPNQYAVFKFVYFQDITSISVNDFKEDDAYINKWLTNSQFKMSKNFMFERIDLSLIRDDYCEIEIFVPVAEKTANNEADSLLIPIQAI